MTGLSGSYYNLYTRHYVTIPGNYVTTPSLEEAVAFLTQRQPPFATTKCPAMSSSIPHICLTCQRVFQTLGLLGLHCAFLRHTPNPFCCIPCGLSFPDRMNLAQVVLHSYFSTDCIDTNTILQKAQLRPLDDRSSYH